MANKTVEARLALYSNTTANWSGSTAVLMKGEVGIEFTTDSKTKIKVGDGVHTWSQLGYIDADTTAQILTITTKLATIAENATYVQSSATNGKIKINGVDTTVYTHPAGTNPHGTTKADVGLGNVNNTADTAKPVSTAQATAIDTAKSEAISAAATDATTKANTAVTTANTYTDGKITSLGTVFTLRGRVDAYANLPSTGMKSGDVYLVGLSTAEQLEEYIYTTESKWEKFGFTTAVDLSNYFTKTEMNTLLAAKAPLNSPTFTGTVSGITKTMVGLSNVDNVKQYSASNPPAVANLSDGSTVVTTADTLVIVCGTPT